MGTDDFYAEDAQSAEDGERMGGGGEGVVEESERVKR